MNKPPTVADVRGILKPYKRIDEMAELRAANERLRATCWSLLEERNALAAQLQAMQQPQKLDA